MSCASTQQCADAGKQLLHMKRFGEVVVSPGVKALNFLTPAVACRQDQNGRHAAAASPGLENADAVLFWQANI